MPGLTPARSNRQENRVVERWRLQLVSLGAVHSPWHSFAHDCSLRARRTSVVMRYSAHVFRESSKLPPRWRSSSVEGVEAEARGTSVQHNRASYNTINPTLLDRIDVLR